MDLHSNQAIFDIELALYAGMFGFFFAEGPITCFEEAAEQVDLEKFGRFHRGMVRIFKQILGSNKLSTHDHFHAR